MIPEWMLKAGFGALLGGLVAGVGWTASNVMANSQAVAVVRTEILARKDLETLERQYLLQTLEEIRRDVDTIEDHILKGPR